MGGNRGKDAAASEILGKSLTGAVSRALALVPQSRLRQAAGKQPWLQHLLPRQCGVDHCCLLLRVLQGQLLQKAADLGRSELRRSMVACCRDRRHGLLPPCLGALLTAKQGAAGEVWQGEREEES